MCRNWSSCFLSRNVAAGTELTWDYAYEVDSVKGKVLHCYCGSAECRGRLLWSRGCIDQLQTAVRAWSFYLVLWARNRLFASLQCGVPSLWWNSIYLLNIWLTIALSTIRDSFLCQVAHFVKLVTGYSPSKDCLILTWFSLRQRHAEKWRGKRECPPVSSLLRVFTKLCAGRFNSNVICKLSTFNGRDISYSYIRKFVLV